MYTCICICICICVCRHIYIYIYIYRQALAVPAAGHEVLAVEGMVILIVILSTVIPIVRVTVIVI